MIREEYARKYTCASCIHYKFEGADEKGRYEKFWAYYWPWDDCKKHWEEAPDWYKDKRPVCK